MEKQKRKYPASDYILAAVFSVIEGIAFFMAGFNLILVTDWFALICGAVLMLFSAGTIYGIIKLITDVREMDAFYEGIANGETLEETFGKMDEAEEE